MMAVAVARSLQRQREELCDKVQRSVEASFAVHVLSIFALEYDVDFAHVVPFNLLTFG